MVNGNDIYVTNCGDSACYSVSPDGVYAMLTEDHGTGNPQELDRCVKAGGTLREQLVHTAYPFPFCCIAHTTAAKPRVMPGGLLVTRAFGDFSAKVDYLGGRKGVVIANHGRISYLNGAKTLPRFLILASDGIWDALSTEDISNTISQFFRDLSEGQGKDPSKIPPPAPASGSPSKVHPHPYGGLIQSPYINANLAEADPELTKLAALLVHTAVKSPKWDEMSKYAQSVFVFNYAFLILFFLLILDI